MFNARSSMKSTPARSVGLGIDGAAVPTQFWTGLGFASLVALVALSPDAKALIEPEEALLGALWIAAVATALWFTLSLLLVQFANRSGSRLLHRLSEQVAMPLARRLAQGSLALGLVALPACGSSTAGRPEMVLVQSGVSTTISSQYFEVTAPVTYQSPTSGVELISTSVPASLTDSLADSLADSPTEAQVPSAPETPTQSTASTEAGPHIVSVGENLWSIAKAQLTKNTDTTPTNAEIGPYWARLVEQNRGSLSSGNANLIYPGEMIQIPAILGAPSATVD